MKKVLFTATVDSHIKHFHIPYLKLFKDNEYEVHVATNTDEPIEYCDVKHKVSFERSPFKTNNLKAINQLKEILDEEKFDIIHTHTPMGSVVTRIAAIETRKQNKTRVIYTAHGFHFYKGAPIINWLLFYPVEKILSKYTDTLITINKEDYELAKKKFTKTNVEYVLGVGVDENKFNFEMTEEEKIKLREEVGCNKDSFILIFSAELSKRKNQGMLIRAMNELVKENDNIHLLLPGKDSMNGKYQFQTKKLGIENNVHFFGYRKDIPKLLKISDVVVSSAKQEGLPVNIIEAMMCGLPVVATDCRGNRDLVIDNENGYIVGIGDYKQFEVEVFKLYSDKKLKKVISINKKEYEIGKVIKDFNRIYVL